MAWYNIASKDIIVEGDPESDPEVEINGWNKWPREYQESDCPESALTATFDVEDFENWYSFSGKPNLEDLDALFGNCVYLAKSEGRFITQSSEELRAAIREWLVSKTSTDINV